jgi:hypothetical protein
MKAMACEKAEEIISIMARKRHQAKIWREMKAAE